MYLSNIKVDGRITQKFLIDDLLDEYSIYAQKRQVKANEVIEVDGVDWIVEDFVNYVLRNQDKIYNMCRVAQSDGTVCYLIRHPEDIDIQFRRIVEIKEYRYLSNYVQFQPAGLCDTFITDLSLRTQYSLLGFLMRYRMGKDNAYRVKVWDNDDEHAIKITIKNVTLYEKLQAKYRFIKSGDVK